MEDPKSLGVFQKPPESSAAARGRSESLRSPSAGSAVVQQPVGWNSPPPYLCYMYIYIYIFIFILYIHAHHLHIYIYMYIHIHICIYIFVFVCTYIYVHYIYVYIYICEYDVDRNRKLMMITSGSKALFCSGAPAGRSPGRALGRPGLRRRFALQSCRRASPKEPWQVQGWYKVGVLS